MRFSLSRLWRDDSGQDLIEYGLLAVFISIIAIATITSLGIAVNSLYADRIEPAIP